MPRALNWTVPLLAGPVRPVKVPEMVLLPVMAAHRLLRSGRHQGNRTGVRDAKQDPPGQRRCRRGGSIGRRFGHCNGISTVVRVPSRVISGVVPPPEFNKRSGGCCQSPHRYKWSKWGAGAAAGRTLSRGASGAKGVNRASAVSY